MLWPQLTQEWRKSSRLTEDRIAELQTEKTERNKCKTMQRILNSLLNIHLLSSTCNQKHLHVHILRLYRQMFLG